MTSETSTKMPMATARQDLALFEDSSYPSQLRDGPIADHHGEYRGFYPGDPGWRPASSRYKGRGGAHGGLDIYAPFALQPLETPVLALADGDLLCRTGTLEPNDLGNRANLAADGVVLSYGHLSRFEGRSRKGVKKGEIIGYAGCSGNADTAGECRACKDCNVNSGHVHLSVRKDDKNVDPRDHYPLSLRFATDQGLGKSMKCADFVKDYGHKAPWQPAPPPAGALVGTQAMDWRRVGGRRQPLAGAFALLEFDATAQLKESANFYRLGAKRLSEAERLKDPKTPGDKLLREFLDEKTAHSVRALRDENGLKSLHDAIVVGDKVIGLDPNEAAVPGWLLLHISRLTQMAWLSFGGAALDALADNSLRGATCTLFTRKAYLTPYKDWKAQHLPQCGAGIGGIAWLSATRTARNALQRTKLSLRAPTGAPSEGPPSEASSTRSMLSVSFGAGSLMHAAVSDHMTAVPPPGRSFSPEMEAAILGYIDALNAAADRLVEVHTLCHAHQVLLSNEAEGPAAQAKRAAILDELRDAIKSTADAFLACPGRIESDAIAAALVTRMTETNAELFDELVLLSRAVEDKEPIGPAFLMLQQIT